MPPRSVLSINPTRVTTATKLRDVVAHAVARGALTSDELGRVVFLSDLRAYLELGDSITGSRYFVAGGEPMAEGLDGVRDRLLARGELTLQAATGKLSTGPARSIAAYNLPDAEARVIDGVLESFRRGEVSDVDEAALRGSRAAAVEYADSGVPVEVPYRAVFVSNRPATPAEEARFLEKARRFGWDIG